MRKNTSVSLGNHFDAFIDKQIAEGRFGTASEVIRAGLRMLEERESRMEVLRRALQEGETSGRAEYSLSALINELDQENAH